MPEPDTPKLTTEEALAHFAGNGTVTQRHDAITALIASKFLPKQADTDAVIVGRSRLLHDAVNHVEPVYRLQAIADSIRLAQVVKRWLPDITIGLEPAFANELPPLSLLSDSNEQLESDADDRLSKDRLNVARACALFERDWLPNYIAKSIVHEKGEKTRIELLTALLLRSKSLADALRSMTAHFEHLRPSTSAPGESLAKRLTRTLSALRTAIIDSDCEAGDDIGKALFKLVTAPIANVGKPQEDKTRIEFSHEVILSVHDIVRTRLSVAADPTIYQAVSFSGAHGQTSCESL